MSDEQVDAGALRQHLTDTKPGPSELRDLLVQHHANSGAVEVLCDYANAEVALQAAVFAAHEQISDEASHDFEQQIELWREAKFDGVTADGMQEFFRAARAAFAGEYELLLGSIAWWFIEYVPLPMLTDEVVAEMSIWEDPPPSQELGPGCPPDDDDPDLVGCWLMSRYLYNRFGDHGPSWDAFKELYDPQTLSIGEAAEQAAHLHNNRFGTHDQ